MWQFSIGRHRAPQDDANISPGCQSFRMALYFLQVGGRLPNSNQSILLIECAYVVSMINQLYEFILYMKYFSKLLETQILCIIITSKVCKLCRNQLAKSCLSIFDLSRPCLPLAKTREKLFRTDRRSTDGDGHVLPLIK